MSIADRFRDLYGRLPEVVVRSPGRVNLIGEHTDYNEGWVLPVAIDLGTDIAAARRPDRTMQVAAEHFATRDVFSIDESESGAGWTRYVRGMVSVLRSAGVDVAGADLLIGGDLPLGAGLSSSASLEMGVGLAVCALAGVDPDRVELALLGQKVENHFVGVQAGIMDQLAVALGRAGHGLLIDCHRLDVTHVRLPDQQRLVVLDSAVPRTLAGSAYNQRRRECEQAVEAVREHDAGVTSLRDVTAEHLQRIRGGVPDVVWRRARHVVSENARVSAAAVALRTGDVDQLGRLFAEGHASLRDDFEVSCSEIEQLVDIAVSVEGVRAVRLTGAGFGGCVVCLVDAERASHAGAAIIERYREASGLPGRAFLCDSSHGCSVIAPVSRRPPLRG